MKTSTMKLADLLTKNDPALFILPYQRKYEWTEEQCAVLLNDALKILASDPKEAPWHFFGTALLSVSEESSISDVRYVLIDGQQRLTTVFLFLAACRDGGSCPRSLAKRLASILFRSGFSRLEQSETDRGEYLKILSSPSSLEDGGRLWENYLFFRREISGLSGSQACLQDLAEAVLERFQMVVLEPERRNGALQDIFESMNSVRIPLSFADLARNWLLMLPDSSAQKELFSSCWIPMEEALKSGNDNDASDFIRSYMEMKACKSYLKPPFSGQPKPCYFEFKRIFSNSPKAALLEDLKIHASLYSQLKTAQTPNTQANSILQDLNAARAEAATPFLLLLFSMRQKGLLSDPDLLRILGAVRTYFLRRRLRGLPSGGAECDFVNLSGRIGELLKAKDKEEAAFALLSSQPKGLWLPNDAELAERLKNKAFCSNNPKMQKFFLSLVEGEISRSHLNPEDPNLTIEHIMPQSLTQKWIEDLGEGADDAHSKLLDNIGNLVIFPSDFNVQAGNKSFKEKKKIYVSQGGLQMTRSYITDRDKWDEGAILRRGERITGIFLRSILPLPPKYRNAQNFAA